MSAYLIGGLAILAAVTLRVMLELRLKSRHPETHLALTLSGRPGNLLVSHMNNARLMAFLVRRAHKGMNDPRLSLLSDAMLLVVVAFLMALLGGAAGLFVTAIFPAAGR